MLYHRDRMWSSNLLEVELLSVRANVTAIEGDGECYGGEE